ncbi:hypothetical protein GPECTOR_1g340 [Gonium pectorale]|uniref:Protein kinase domain-containing protein n=1 Tax=Gonium pectorale TaxID=33097 RepID=A0A150H2X9_GONPE|nr:hypothetical protein GPECTOR_1g340 [Gonium pectorale]|eukprot:KXZ56384.1 hypothetical protein GPECTOR_1g340 [Gonium pectorale]
MQRGMGTAAADAIALAPENAEQVPEAAGGMPEAVLPSLAAAEEAVDAIGTAPETTAQVPEVEAAETVPGAAEKVLKSARASPDVAEQAPEASVTEPEAADKAPEAADEAPEVADKAPEVPEAAPESADQAREAGVAAEDAEQVQQVSEAALDTGIATEPGPQAQAAPLAAPEAAPAESVAEPTCEEAVPSAEAAVEGSSSVAKPPAPAPAADDWSISLPPGVSPEDAQAAVIRIQSHARGFLARRQVAELRKGHEAGQAALTAAVSAAAKVNAFELPPGVTPEMAEAAAIRVQAHARGYFARRKVALLRRGLGPDSSNTAEGGAPEQQDKAQGEQQGHEESEFELPPGVTPEMAEAAAIRVQAHARGYFARRRVRQLRTASVAPVVPTELPVREDADMALREAGEAVGMGLGPEDPAAVAAAAAAAAAAAEDELEGMVVKGLDEEAEPAAAKEEEGPQELTVDALKAALADDEDDDVAAGTDGLDTADAAAAEGATPEVDMSDPAAVAAAAAAAAAASKGAVRIFGENGDTLADTAAAADQATAEEVSMARLAANSARTSAMFQGAGAEMRYSDDEASALELMDNLDGLLQGDDEAAAAAAAVAAAAAAAPADGELVSISPHGVSAPQALGASGTGSATSPMDVVEPGGVRVLAGKYEVQHVVGEGAYGMVMKCKVRGTEPPTWVAIKEFKIDDNDPDAEDVKRTSLREVAVLEALQHPHVVRFVDKFMVGDRLFIVMEFLPCNLLELLEAQPGGMDRDAVRLIMFQLCSAIAFIHSKGMLYRDIKPENLLVDESGTVKLCDFGFARYLPSKPTSHLTDYVATRWYRAPELLLGPPYKDSTGRHIQYMYGPQVDMWAVGCLMGELLDGEPLFAGDSDLDQLYRVQQVLGPMAPSHQYLFYANPHNTGIVFNIKQPLTLSSRYRGKVSDVELDFMSGLLNMDPDRRLTGEQCLQHPYLSDLAAAALAASLPSTPMPSNPAAPSDDFPVPVAAALAAEDEEATSQSAVTAAAGPDVLSTPRGPPSESGLSGLQTPHSRGLAVANSLTKRAGSLTRGAGSLTRTRGSMRGGGTPPMRSSYSPLPQLGAEPLRAGSLVRAHESGEVVIVEGVVEAEADREVKSPLRSVGSQSGVIAAVAG